MILWGLAVGGRLGITAEFDASVSNGGSAASGIGAKDVDWLLSRPLPGGFGGTRQALSGGSVLWHAGGAQIVQIRGALRLDLRNKEPKRAAMLSANSRSFPEQARIRARPGQAHSKAIGATRARSKAPDFTTSSWI
jgi:ethanolamine utilization microcompartment shell protein EutL